MLSRYLTGPRELFRDDQVVIKLAMTALSSIPSFLFLHLCPQAPFFQTLFLFFGSQVMLADTPVQPLHLCSHRKQPPHNQCVDRRFTDRTRVTTIVFLRNQIDNYYHTTRQTKKTHVG